MRCCWTRSSNSLSVPPRARQQAFCGALHFVPTGDVAFLALLPLLLDALSFCLLLSASKTRSSRCLRMSRSNSSGACTLLPRSNGRLPQSDHQDVESSRACCSDRSFIVGNSTPVALNSSFPSKFSTSDFFCFICSSNIFARRSKSVVLQRSAVLLAFALKSFPLLFQSGHSSSIAQRTVGP